MSTFQWRKWSQTADKHTHRQHSRLLYLVRMSTMPSLSSLGFITCAHSSAYTLLNPAPSPCSLCCGCRAVYGKCPAITSIFLYGNSYKSFVVGVVVPAVDYWSKYFHQQQWWSEPIRIGDPNFPAAFAAVWQAHEAELKQQLVALLKQQEKDINGIERARDWLVEYRVDRDGNGWTPANSLMTPTFKVRRPQMVHYYIKQLKQLYATNGEPAAADEHWPGE